MTLPDFSKVEIPKRIAATLFGLYFIKEVQDIRMALILAGLLAVGIIAQTLTDVWGKAKNGV